MPVDWENCRRSGGPFAAFVWNTQEHEPTIIAATLLLILINIPTCATLYSLARLCNRKDAADYARRRAQKTSEIIDEHSAAMNRREVLRVRKIALEADPRIYRARFLSDAVDATTEEEERMGQRYMDKLEQEITEQSRKVDILAERLESTADKLSLTERMSCHLSEGTRWSNARARTVVFGTMLTLLVLSVPPVVLAPFAIEAHVHCDAHSPPTIHQTSGYWIAYAVLDAGPTALAWLQVARAARYWRHPSDGDGRDLAARGIEAGDMSDTSDEEKAEVQQHQITMTKPRFSSPLSVIQEEGGSNNLRPELHFEWPAGDEEDAGHENTRRAGQEN